MKTVSSIVPSPALGWSGGAVPVGVGEGPAGAAVWARPAAARPNTLPASAAANRMCFTTRFMLRTALNPLGHVVLGWRTTLRRELVDHVRQRVGQLREELVAGHAGLLLQDVDGVVAEHAAEFVRVDRLVLAVVDPRIDHVAAAALLEGVDEPAEAGAQQAAQQPTAQPAHAACAALGRRA